MNRSSQSKILKRHTERMSRLIRNFLDELREICVALTNVLMQERLISNFFMALLSETKLNKSKNDKQWLERFCVKVREKESSVKD
ncbi:hypothetical protein M514_03539 [Trichuris suis]|uniref:Uncharacterized protein n=1 Tax=Trichuris suis TaxID=68888 RepID=A0A085NP94_9BILA|nr:hypothetical protein M513_03539 [Trichuris suis]KFD71290.1 hypothetical protein M514_03539 [Trichuris suis]